MLNGDILVFLSSITFLLQAVTFALALTLAWILHHSLLNLCDPLQRRLAPILWTKRLFDLIEVVLFPFAVWLFNHLAIFLFQVTGIEPPLLERSVPLLTLWLFYRLSDYLLRAKLHLVQARLWSDRVLLPAVLFTGVLYALELLDDFLEFSLATIADDELKSVTIGSALGGLLLIVFFFGLSRTVWSFLRRRFLPQAGADPALAHAISALTSYAIIVVGVIIGLAVVGINLTALTVIVGGLSIGLGFGLQDLFSNLISGFILMFERSIAPGDVIEIGDKTGVVQDIGLRRMIIKTPDNIELLIPNSKFLTETMTNLTHGDPTVRERISVGVSYNASPREVEQALLEAAKHPGVLKNPPPCVHFSGFGESSLVFDLLVWTNESFGLDSLTSEIRYQIWDALAIRKIEIPFPQRDLHIRSAPPWFNTPHH